MYKEKGLLGHGPCCDQINTESPKLANKNQFTLQIMSRHPKKRTHATVELRALVIVIKNQREVCRYPSATFFSLRHSNKEQTRF